MSIPVRHRVYRRAATMRPARRLRINNRTGYRMDDLRALICAGLVHGSVPLGLPLHVDVIHEPQYGGAAIIGHIDDMGEFVPGQWMLLCGPEDLDARRLAQIIEHEIEHLIGLDHDVMPPHHELAVAWAEGLKLRRKPKR